MPVLARGVDPSWSGRGTVGSDTRSDRYELMRAALGRPDVEIRPTVASTKCAAHCVTVDRRVSSRTAIRAHGRADKFRTIRGLPIRAGPCSVFPVDSIHAR